MLALAGTIGSLMIGGLYVAAGRAADRVGPEPTRVAITPVEETPAVVDPLPAGVDLPPDLPAGVDVPPDLVAALAEWDEIVDPTTGVVLGPLTVVPVEVEPVAAPSSTARRAPAAARRAPRPAVPRLHPDPGRHVILTARGMMARNEVVQGSCYRYLSEVFTRAGHDSWRTRRTVFTGQRNGPYADLDLIRPGDWLYIVNHPNRTPVGTHSVLFVGWQDRSRGIAHVIEHPGGGWATAGQERGYDVSRTYRIKRPTS